ncbi:Putative uncharacterized protein [Lactobacillus helveticus CIRM-BIA 101]|nr:Putative uncharacterized protein [Lactobacillus helveticus CIRM-BIA 104]CDI64448.1 Putative uncharacterized protein [Lactobacillus helveticus CIRM-BIA 101]
MTTYKKKLESKKLSGRDALYRDKIWFKEFEKTRMDFKSRS